MENEFKNEKELNQQRKTKTKAQPELKTEESELCRGKDGRGEGRERRHPQFAKKQNVTEPDLRTASIPTPSDFLLPQTLFTVTIILPLFHSPFMSPLFISADW